MHEPSVEGAVGLVLLREHPTRRRRVMEFDSSASLRYRVPWRVVGEGSAPASKRTSLDTFAFSFPFVPVRISTESGISDISTSNKVQWELPPNFILDNQSTFFQHDACSGFNVFSKNFIICRV